MVHIMIACFHELLARELLKLVHWEKNHADSKYDSQFALRVVPDYELSIKIISNTDCLKFINRNIDPGDPRYQSSKFELIAMINAQCAVSLEIPDTRYDSVILQGMYYSIA